MKAIFPVLALLIIVLASGCVSQDVRELQGVEIREYQGEQLSSIAEIRDLSIKGPQNIDIQDYSLKVFGLVESPRDYTYEEALDRQRYSKVVALYCVTGWDTKTLWEGILIEDLLDEVGVSQEVDTVIFRAYDGYSTSLPLDFILDNDIMLAYKVNNVTLTPSTGYPFILVAEQKWGYKWIKWVTEIELSDDPTFEGYWESRGYSNDGSIEQHYFD